VHGQISLRGQWSARRACGTYFLAATGPTSFRHARTVSEPIVIYKINGDRVHLMRGFYEVVGEAVNGPGGYFGQDLDSLSDCLAGGFGTPEGQQFVFVWTNSVRSRAVLGYPETVRQLELRLARCHPRTGLASLWT
jgi:hypothetical protein